MANGLLDQMERSQVKLDNRANANNKLEKINSKIKNHLIKTHAPICDSIDVSKSPSPRDFHAVIFLSHSRWRNVIGKFLRKYFFCKILHHARRPHVSLYSKLIESLSFCPEAGQSHHLPPAFATPISCQSIRSHSVPIVNHHHGPCQFVLYAKGRNHGYGKGTNRRGHRARTIVEDHQQVLQ